MLDIIIIILLIAGLFIGLRRGFILQLIHLTGFIVAYVAAYMYYDDLAPKLKLWIPFPSAIDHNSFFEHLSPMSMEAAYYRAIAFVIIFIAVKIIMHIIGSMLDFLADLPILRTINSWFGGILGFLEIYLVLFILLYLGSLTPYAGIESAIDHSFMAHLIIENTPVLSEKIKNMWMAYIH
ncbi:putative membrane protein required for colicin V production [Scopulibacillus darangshiensis]|uniref:Putative membrane protein required for colicin V production n=1 Tax=Scopulibacillus darangshiensis TaxID=442528 RepID=A0A4R2PDX7_9BACL|nr:CvpA family protein [Scopulibacillus darangshiensis]TCP32125.1 putative membrane protein required for colicin V production [Scopulibacillus darangshiensis]